MRLQMCSVGVGGYMCPTLLVFYQYNHMKALSPPFQVPSRLLPTIPTPPLTLYYCSVALFLFYAKVLSVPCGQLLIRNVVVSLIKA